MIMSVGRSVEGSFALVDIAEDARSGGGGGVDVEHRGGRLVDLVVVKGHSQLGVADLSAGFDGDAVAKQLTL